jgi:signal peptidase I
VSLAVQTGGESAQASGPQPPPDLASSAIPPDQPAAFGGVAHADAAASRPGAVTHHRHGLLHGFQSLLYVIVIALFIITFIVQPFRIPSESMEPTLLVGDFLLVDKEIGLEVPPRVLAPTNMIQRGDLIVFHYPVDSSLHLVKRVVGLPGDHLRLRDGHVYIDGRALSEPYAVFRPAVADSYRDDFPRMSSADPGVDSRWWIQMRSLIANGELTVPADSYFVLGDNRNDSEDSRYWGFVPRAAVVGKPFLIYFSLKSLDNTAGELAAAKSSAASGRSGVLQSSFVDFARWDRVLRVIR